MHEGTMPTATTTLTRTGARVRYHVGLDVHQASIVAAVADSRAGTVSDWGHFATREAGLGKLVARLQALGTDDVWCCYEAGHYRHKPQTGPALKRRRQGQPTAVIMIAQRAQQRLYRRCWQLVDRQQKPAAKAAVAVARELLGFVWAVWRDVLAHHADAPVTAA